MLTIKQKRDIVRQAIQKGFPVDKIPFYTLVNNVEKYIESGNMNPKDPIYQFIPEQYRL